MAAGAQVRGWTGPSRRRVPRFLLQAPLDVTVLRSGIPDTVPGRSVNVCERGISAMLAGELVPGEAVGIEVRLSQAMDALRARGWEKREGELKNGRVSSADKPQAQVPAEVMEKLLVHKVEPTYPPEARKENLQGIIALDIVVGRDGSVVSMHALNGPEVLARAAMDALRWWKFEPYRVNGEPAVVETTVAVEFKR